MNSYKKIKSLEERRKESDMIYRKYKVKIPVIVIVDSRVETTKGYYKFLVSADIRMSDLQYIIRRKVKIKSSDAIFYLTENNCMLNGNFFINDIYKKHRDKEDNMLYIFINSENTFGF